LKETVATSDGIVSSYTRGSRFWTSEFGLELTQHGLEFLANKHKELKDGVFDLTLPAELEPSKSSQITQEKQSDESWISNWLHDASPDTKHHLRVSIVSIC
jgi:hypothetical protein